MPGKVKTNFGLSKNEINWPLVPFPQFLGIPSSIFWFWVPGWIAVHPNSFVDRKFFGQAGEQADMESSTPLQVESVID